MWKNIKTAPTDRKVLMYRPDTKTIFHGYVRKEFMNHPEYAYTDWMEAPPLPDSSLYDELPSDVEP